MTKKRTTIEEVCERYGVTARTLHYYEEIGLLTGVPRTEGGHRYYDERIEAQLEQIIRLKDLMGISLQEIKVVIEMESELERIRNAYRAEQSSEEREKFIEEGADVLGTYIGQMDSRIAKLQELRDSFRQRLDRINGLRGQGKK